MLTAKVLAALSLLFSPAGGYHGHYKQHGQPASFRVGAAVQSITPPKRVAHDPALCAGASAFTGPRPFAFIEPYKDTNHNGHFDPGEPYLDCNHDGRWDGNLLGGGDNTPRYYDHVADPVTARAMVVSNGKQKIAVEVLDQEGLFNVYQAQIRAKVRAAGVHLNGIFISATHDESAPDSLGLGGVSPDHIGCQQLLGALPGRPKRPGDRERLPSHAQDARSATPRCSSRATSVSAGPPTRSSTTSTSRCWRP